MLRIISILCGLILVAYLAYESAVSLRKYRRLKHQIADGYKYARSRFYREILFFEWVSAVLAFGALQFDLDRFNPASLQIASTAFGRWWISAWNHLDAGFLTGFGIGAAISVTGLIIVLRRARRRGVQASKSRQSSPVWQRLFPDFSALIPVTAKERALFALVAISAGICEEVVYRAWLLDLLHGSAGLSGATLVIVAAVLFGLGHYYQGYSGIVITSLLGLAFCGLYIASGTLLVPIIVHALIDLRLAIFPTLSIPAKVHEVTP